MKPVNKVVDVLVGMQFGSEGKGKIVSMIAQHYDASVRVGAPNAGHTIYNDGHEYKMRTIPCAWINEKCKLYIGPGGLINLDVLRDEIASLPGGVEERLFIDFNAGVVTHKDAELEAGAKMYESIGSTTEGVGEAMARKILRRDGNGPIASSVENLQPFLTGVLAALNRHVEANQAILVEGTQGFGLSLNHGYYPYVTSRDVLASSMLGECGLAPSTVRDVIGVLRSYPIRVHGNSGPMGAKELTWDEVAELSGYKARGVALEERTTVTKRVRRVSMINWDLLGAAVAANRPTCLALTFLDYIDCDDAGVKRWGDVSQKSKSFIAEVERRLDVPVKYISTGPMPSDGMIINVNG